MSPTRMLIGARIKTHRKARKITQAVLAEALDCEVTTLGRYERGEYSPDGEQLMKLAAFFNVSPIDFLPTDIEVRWQVVCDLRAVLIDQIYRIDDPAELQHLIIIAKHPKKANLR